MADGNTRAGGNTKSGADGNTKREAPVTWRPSPAARLALAKLLEGEDVSRGELLNRLVIAAVFKTDAQSSALPAVAGKPLELDGSGVGVTKVINASFQQAGRPDPDKLAAFQRKAGMGGVKSRG